MARESAAPHKVTTSTITLLALVVAADDEHYEPDTAYIFSNDRKFESSDKSDSGIYD